MMKLIIFESILRASFQSAFQLINLYYSLRNKAIIANGMIVIYIKSFSWFPWFPCEFNKKICVIRVICVKKLRKEV